MISNAAAKNFQESPIRRIGGLSATIPGLISLSAGYPAPDMFPWKDIESISAQILARHDGNTLQYGETRGYRPLIEHLIANTLHARGIASRFEDVIITSGSQQGLDLVGRVMIDPGDRVIVELPTYSGAIAAFHNLQASLVGVPQDGEGIEIAAVDRVATELATRGRPAKFIYVTPNFQNPAGLLMSAQRRRDLLDAGQAARSRDCRRRSLRVDLLRGRDELCRYPADQGRRHRRAGDLPGELLEDPGAGAARRRGWWRRRRGAERRAPQAGRRHLDWCLRSAHRAWSDRPWRHRSHRAGAARSLPGKRSVMERALNSHLAGRVTWTSPRGGFFLWIEMPGVDDRALLERALEAKVSFVPGAHSSSTATATNSPASRSRGITHDQIEEGVRRLSAAIQ